MQKMPCTNNSNDKNIKWQNWCVLKLKSGINPVILYFYLTTKPLLMGKRTYSATDPTY